MDRWLIVMIIIVSGLCINNWKESSRIISSRLLHKNKNTKTNTNTKSNTQTYTKILTNPNITLLSTTPPNPNPNHFTPTTPPPPLNKQTSLHKPVFISTNLFNLPIHPIIKYYNNWSFYVNNMVNYVVILTHH